MSWRHAVLAAGVLVAGCSKAPLSQGPGGVDPGECFDKMKDAMARSDWGALWDQGAPDTRGDQLAAVIGPWARIRLEFMESASTTKAEPESVHFVEAVLKGHGVSLNSVAKGLGNGPEILQESIAGVADKRGLFVAVMVQTSRAPEIAMPLLDRLEDLRIDGDRATGTGIARFREAEVDRKDLTFQKVGDRWFRVHGR